MKTIPMFPLELLTVINIFFTNINLKRMGSYLYKAFQKNNMEVLPRNTTFLKRCTFGINRYA
jgi:hypothetical protein